MPFTGQDKLNAAPKILAVVLGGRTYGETAEEIYDDYVVYVIEGSSIYLHVFQICGLPDIRLAV